MPPSLPKVPLPDALAMPLRDALRGLRRSMPQPGDLAEPAEAMLPDPLFRLVRDIAQRLEKQAGALSSEAEAQTLQQVRAVAQFDRDRAAIARFAELSYRALNLALKRIGQPGLLVSETVAGMAYQAALTRLPAEAGATQTAAAIAAELYQHHVSGIAPGTSLLSDPAEQGAVQTAIIAFLLWLVVERDAPDPNEAELLALCVDVVQSEKPDFEIADAEAVAGFLDTFRAVI